MKTLVLSLVLVASCSSWKQKDFEKSLDKPVEATPTVDVDKKLLEKFEVQEARPEVKAVAVKKAPAAPVRKAQTPAPVKKLPPVVAQAPAVKALPADYPPEFEAINASAKKVWELYRPIPENQEKTYLDIHYMGMTIGKIMVANNGHKTINGKDVWHFHARFKSAPFYSSIYELDDTVDTYVTSDKFLSSRYSLIQRESKQNIDDLQLHDREQLKTFWFYKQKRPGQPEKKKEVEKPIPYYSIDPFSLVFFYQGLPLKNSDVYEIPIINKGKILIMKSKVEGREKLETEIGTKNAIRIHATTQYSGDTLKSGDLYFWFSDDEKRTLLRGKAKIKIGSVTADIVKK